MTLNNTKQNSFQNAFQNAAQLQNFSYANTEVAIPSASLLILILAFILLGALLRSEARCRALLERIAHIQNGSASG